VTHDTPIDQPVTLDSRIAVLSELGTDTALELPPGLDMATWAEVGETLIRVERAILWWLGDWWRYGEHHYGEGAYHAAPTGYALSTVRKAAWVAEQIEPGRRRADVPHSHHEAVASLPPKVADRILARAAIENLTLPHVRQIAGAARIGAPEPAETHDYRCPNCGTEWDGSPRP
jgi:hypothetical protein